MGGPLRGNTISPYTYQRGGIVYQSFEALESCASGGLPYEIIKISRKGLENELELRVDKLDGLVDMCEMDARRRSYVVRWYGESDSLKFNETVNALSRHQLIDWNSRR